MKKFVNIIKLMRPKHYIKNLLIFVCVFFDRDLLSPSVLFRALGGFCAFCLISSVVYIFNDIHDVEEDRLHEIKKNRPIAAGTISAHDGYIIAAILFVMAIILNLFSAKSVLTSFVIIGLYFAVNLGYSLGLKEIPILDIVLLVSGFFLRVLYGAALVGSFVSSWVYLTVISLSFYLGLGKRRNELKKMGSSGSTRRVLTFYSYSFLDKFMYLCLTLAITFYSLWSADAAIVDKYSTDKLVWTVPLVMIIMMKYSADIESGSYGDPVDGITHDKLLLFLGFLYALILFGLIYLA